MARAIRASASSAVIVHSEKGFDSRKLDAGRMAHPPFGCPSPIMVASKLFPPKLGDTVWLNPLPNYRDAEVLRSATGSKSINQPPSMGKAARVATSGLLTSTLGYPARGPASWRRRSESSIITDSAVVAFTESPSSHVQ